MLRSILGAVIGSSMARRGGGGSVKGAILGATAQRVVTRMGPFGWAMLGVIGLWRLVSGRKRGPRYR
ncbi:hypothetical protein DMC47_26145 [Nostoc sp. 3335mG]|nr:hypothetical protein DMC47_26145 [Nostoc sp. 3335mG]